MSTTTELERAVRLAEAKRDRALVRLDSSDDDKTIGIFDPARHRAILAMSDSELDEAMMSDDDRRAVAGWHGLSAASIAAKRAMRRDALRSRARIALSHSHSSGETGEVRTDGVTRDVTRVTRNAVCHDCLRLDSADHVCTTTTTDEEIHMEKNDEQHEKQLINESVDRAMSRHAVRTDADGPEISYRRRMRDGWKQPLLSTKQEPNEGAVPSVRTDAEETHHRRGLDDAAERERLHAELRANRDREAVRLDDASAAPDDPVSKARAEMIRRSRAMYRLPLRVSREGGGYDGSGGGQAA